MSTLTLIGMRLAREGTEFVYHGEADACEGCPYRGQCLTLTKGRKYRVTSVRENAQTLECGVHDTGVNAVEVEPAAMRANVPSKGVYAGSKASPAGGCPHTECPSHEFCVPDGVDPDGEYRVNEVVGDPPHDSCMLNRDLTMVEFAPPEE